MLYGFDFSIHDYLIQSDLTIVFLATGHHASYLIFDLYGNVF